MEEDLLATLDKNLADTFKIKDIQKRLRDKAKEEEPAAQAAAQPQAPQWRPIDMYQHHQRKQNMMRKKEFPRGSRALVRAVVESIIKGGKGTDGLAFAKKRAEDDAKVLSASGYKDRAEIRKQQYMDEKFLPAIEAAINYSSPDELLNCKDALAALDKMAIGVGSMRGFTESYIRQAYGDVLGQTRGGSDPTVVAEMRRIRALVSSDQIRTAIGLATKLKKQIDDGEHMAEPEDYAVLGRIVAYAN